MTTDPTSLAARVEDALAAWRDARDVTDEWEYANSQRCNVFADLAADWQRLRERDDKNADTIRGLEDALAVARSSRDFNFRMRMQSDAELTSLRERERVLTEALCKIIDIERSRMWNGCIDCDTPSVCAPKQTCTVESQPSEIARAALAPEPLPLPEAPR